MCGVAGPGGTMEAPIFWCRLQCWLVSLFPDGWGTWARSILVGHPSTHTIVTNDIPMEHHPTGCIPLLRAALTGYHTPGDQGQWKWISSQLSGQSPKPECGQVWALSGNPEENFIPCLSPGFCCLLAILGLYLYLSSLFLHLCMARLCVLPSVS